MHQNPPLIGLLGGTSWPSTISYYRYLNQQIQQRFGMVHSARIMLYSMDYAPIKSLYHAGWDHIPALLEREIDFFLEKQPDCLILCNNTLHRALDTIMARRSLSIKIHHAGHVTADAAIHLGYQSVLLLGTCFTMEDGFFAHYLTQRGIDVCIPNVQDREQIGQMQTQVACGADPILYRDALLRIVQHYGDVDAVILACTELPLILDKAHRPILDPARLQCDVALKTYEISS
jgi:aspartate racemase